VNKSDLIDAIADHVGGRAAATKAVEAFLDTVTRAVAAGEKVALSGFGVFEKAERAARTGRNPATGAVVKIRKTSVPKFRPGTEFKAYVKGTKKFARLVVAKAAPAVKATVAARPAAKAPVKKVVAKAPAKKAPAKAPVKKVVAAKAPAKKAPVKTPVKKVVAKAPAKAPVKKVVAAKATAKKAPVKAPVKKAVATRVVAKKVPAKKAPTRTTRAR
jgi:DNA-binding protein HU-beta